MTTTTGARDKKAQLIRDGYCVFEQVLAPGDVGPLAGCQRRSAGGAVG